MLRRSSLAAPSGEPLIVVEESGGIQEEEEEEETGKEQESAPDSPLLNPYLLSPYRDMRKRFLPTPQCTSGITASQMSNQKAYQHVEKLKDQYQSAPREVQRDVARRIGVEPVGVAKNTEAAKAQSHEGNISSKAGVAKFQSAGMGPKFDLI